jgi:hypothetical protein
MHALFRTPLSTDRLSLMAQDASVLTAGSCFADNLGQKLKAYKWPCLVNPFGTQFHPLAIFDLLARALRQDSLPPDLFLESDGAAYHYYLPRTHFADSFAALEKSFAGLSANVRASMSKPKTLLILTFGSAWIYEKNQQWVSNCHQQPQKIFQKRLLQLDEMMDAAAAFLAIVPSQTSILLSLSPVRHLRDGLVENSLSKSLLLVFIHRLLERWPRRFHYFPAYELMMDDLRDYRFYGDDMLHPNETALNYIWDLFTQSILDTDAEKFVHRFTPLLQALQHSSLRPNSGSQKAFQRKVLRDLEAFSGIDLSEEIAKLSKELENTSD